MITQGLGGRGKIQKQKISWHCPFKINGARELHAKNNKYFAYCHPDFSRTRESNLSKEQFWQEEGGKKTFPLRYMLPRAAISRRGGGSQTAPSVSDDLNHKTRIHEAGVRPGFFVVVASYCRNPPMDQRTIKTSNLNVVVTGV